MVGVDLDVTGTVVLEEVSELVEGVDDGVQFFVADGPTFLGILECAGVEYDRSYFSGLGVALRDDLGVGSFFCAVFY